jgi:hypothetical protein
MCNSCAGTTGTNVNASSYRGSSSGGAPTGSAADWPTSFDVCGTCPGCITRPSKGIFAVKQLLKRNTVIVSASNISAHATEMLIEMM